MDFNFAQTYASYTTEALLQIVAEPHKYQPAAIAAAQSILDSRPVTDAEREAAAATLNAATKPRPVKLPKLGFSIPQEMPFESNSIFAEEALTLTELKSIKLWRLLVVALMGLPATLSLFYLVRNFSEALTTRNHGYASLLFSGMWFSLISIAEPGIGIILFLKNKRWGWGWLAAYAAYMTTSYVTGLIITLFLSSFRHYSFLNIIFLVLAGSSVYLLWRQPMRRYYTISTRLAMRVVIIAATLSFIVRLFSIVPFLMYR